MTDDTINKIDAQQNSRMAVLEQQLKDLKEDVDRVTQEENERLKGRIRHLEKWVAGAGAVIGVAVAGLGLVEVTDFGFAKTGTHVEFDAQTNSNRFLDHEFARLRHCGEQNMRGWQFHPSSPSAWICQDVVPYYSEE